MLNVNICKKLGSTKMLQVSSNVSKSVISYYIRIKKIDIIIIL